MDFAVENGINVQGSSTITIRKDTIYLRPASGAEEVYVTVWIDPVNNPTSINFQLQHCDDLRWTLDDGQQGEVGEGPFTVPLS